MLLMPVSVKVMMYDTWFRPASVDAGDMVDEYVYSVEHALP
jgi:hypothetical protein